MLYNDIIGGCKLNAGIGRARAYLIFRMPIGKPTLVGVTTLFEAEA